MSEGAGGSARRSRAATERTNQPSEGADDLLGRAVAWAAEDPDPETRAELERLVDRAGQDAAARAELADRFEGTLEFGTAGLRGAMGAGPNRMNRVVVTKAAAGLAAYLSARGAGGGSVVIGYDARHKSEAFATDTAAVLAGAGLQALLLPRPLPTPVLAYAIRKLNAAAGVMVTASHNPPQDNGYKVYLGDGCQIVPPADAEICALIEAVGPVGEVPRSDRWLRLDDEVEQAYLADVSALADSAGPRNLRIAYTPLHGVGGDTTAAVLRRAGFSRLHVVPEQAEPDPDFPTAAFPNPEEPGAMDLVVTLGRQVGADVAVANDPDADRCAVAVPAAPGWRMLRGDEVGVLLADFLLRRGVAGMYACSIVSSSLLGELASAAGQGHRETLTGFKWIGRVDGLVFGYEEALGYCVAPQLVKDKDGVSALLLVCELAARLKGDGKTLADRLDEIAREHGLYATDQLSVRVADQSQIEQAMTLLRAEPPGSLGGLDVLRVDDLAAGVGGLPPTEGLRYRLGENARVVVRPSGTEPKLKCYLEAVVSVDAGSPDGVEAARIVAAHRLDALKKDMTARLALGEVIGNERQRLPNV